MARSKQKQQRSGPRGAAPIVDGLYLSGEDTARNPEQLRSLGIKSIVACGCPAHFPNEFRYLRVTLPDHADAHVDRWLDPTADFISDSLRIGAVLVHCKAGICRSPTMVIAYLLKHRQAMEAPDVAAALALVRSARPCASPRAKFITALDAFAQRNLWLAPGAASSAVVPPQAGPPWGLLPKDSSLEELEVDHAVCEMDASESSQRHCTNRRGMRMNPDTKGGARASSTTEAQAEQSRLEGERARLESQLAALAPLQASVAQIKGKLAHLRTGREFSEIANINLKPAVSEESCAALTEAESMLADATRSLKAIMGPMGLVRQQWADHAPCASVSRASSHVQTARVYLARS